MSSAYSNTSYANMGELSPSDNAGDNSFDVNYVPSSYGEWIESSYNAGSEYIPALNEQFPDLGLDVYSHNDLSYDGSQVVPVYYPIPSFYQLYNGVSAVESNGTIYYNYYQFAVPMYCISPDLTTENFLTSEATSVSHPDDFSNEIFENLNPDSYFDHITPSSNIAEDLSDSPGDSIPEEFIDDFTASYDEASSSDRFNPSCNDAIGVAGDSPVPDFVNDFTAYYDEAKDSSIVIPENDFIAEERKNDIKRKKDWLYLLSLSGKLHVKDHIPEVHVMPEISEENESVEISQELSESDDSFEKEMWSDVIPEIDKSDGDQKNAIESSYTNGAHKGKCQASEVENYLWDDFFCSIDDPVFGIEACFNNASEKESSVNDLHIKNFNLSSTCGKTFLILTRLNKQIEILPTIEEEEEGVVKSEEIHIVTEMIPVKLNNENIKSLEEGCLKSEQQNAEKMEDNCGLPEATEKVDHSQKPTKKRFKRIRRFFSELRSCFRKSKDPAG